MFIYYGQECEWEKAAGDAASRAPKHELSIPEGTYPCGFCAVRQWAYPLEIYPLANRFEAELKQASKQASTRKERDRPPASDSSATGRNNL
jgi:hypothetical protein